MKIIAESYRLIMREMNLDDAAFFYRLNLDPEVLKYTGDQAFSSIEEAKMFIESYDQYSKYNMGRWIIIRKEDDKIVGWCGLKYHAKEEFVDLGFRFIKDEWNNGYATESANLSLDYGFNILGLKEIIGRADIRNHPSIRVLQKVGMNEFARSIEHGNSIALFKIVKDQYSIQNNK